jgi:hypothetical protein
MAVRPSWVDVRVDGRKSEVGTGPLAKDGGMRACFKLRENGDVVTGLTVETRSDGVTVSLLVWDGDGNLVYRVSKPY